MIAAAIGAFIGIVLGLTGAGGSIFAVPLLVTLLDLPPQTAIGIALGAVAVSAALGAVAQYRQVLWIPAILLSIGGVLTAPIGRWLAVFFSDTFLVVGFTCLAVWIAARMIRQANRQPENTKQVRASHFAPENMDQQNVACRMSPTGQFQMAPKCLLGLGLGGALVGVVSGIFGVGGGFLIIPLLMYLSSVSMPKAIATSLVVITWVSASGFISHLLTYELNEPLLFVKVLIASLVGMLVSRRLSSQISGPWLQKIFASLLVFVSFFMLFKTFFQWMLF